MRRGLIGTALSLARGKRQNRAVGGWGERLAERHLYKRGHRILERNWRSRGGEIDLISALPDGTIIFTEVKTRRGTAHGEPLEAVDADKSDQVMRVAQDYLRKWRIERRPVRFDLIGIEVDATGDAHLDHVEGII